MNTTMVTNVKRRSDIFVRKSTLLSIFLLDFAQRRKHGVRIAVIKEDRKQKMKTCSISSNTPGCRMGRGYTRRSAPYLLWLARSSFTVTHDRTCVQSCLLHYNTQTKQHYLSWNSKRNELWKVISLFTGCSRSFSISLVFFGFSIYSTAAILCTFIANVWYQCLAQVCVCVQWDYQPRPLHSAWKISTA